MISVETEIIKVPECFEHRCSNHVDLALYKNPTLLFCHIIQGNRDLDVIAEDNELGLQPSALSMTPSTDAKVTSFSV